LRSRIHGRFAAASELDLPEAILDQVHLFGDCSRDVVIRDDLRAAADAGEYDLQLSLELTRADVMLLAALRARDVASIISHPRIFLLAVSQSARKPAGSVFLAHLPLVLQRPSPPIPDRGNGDKAGWG
jgi:hypothetical protein